LPQSWKGFALSFQIAPVSFAINVDLCGTLLHPFTQSPMQTETTSHATQDSGRRDPGAEGGAPELRSPGTRDVDVADQQRKIDAASAWLSSATSSAPVTRRFVGVGELERTGYIPEGSSAEREASNVTQQAREPEGADFSPTVCAAPENRQIDDPDGAFR